MTETNVETVANWLHGAARELDLVRTLRKLAGKAAAMCIDMYGQPEELIANKEVKEDPPHILARFCSALDQIERHMTDNSSHP